MVKNKMYLLLILLIPLIYYFSFNFHLKHFSYLYNIIVKSDYENIEYDKYSIKFLSDGKKYEWSGEACGKNKFNTNFEKTISSDDQYLCKIKESSEIPTFESEVTYKLSYNFSDEIDNSDDISCSVIINYKEDFIELNIKLNEKFNVLQEYGVDYYMFISCGNNNYNGIYEGTHNLKKSDINRKKFEETISIDFESFLSFEKLTEKIKNDNLDEEWLLFEDVGDKKTYYFQGDVDNNYVNFAGYMWRIIRINEDDSIRLILDGDIGKSAWNNVKSNYLSYSTRYSYGDLSYKTIPYLEKYTENFRNTNYCYGDNVNYSDGKFKLIGDIICQNQPLIGKYSLFSSNKGDTSDTYYLIESLNNNFYYNVGKFGKQHMNITKSPELYYSNDYEIVDGQFKLVNPKMTEFNYDNRGILANKYTFYSNNPNYSQAHLYQISEYNYLKDNYKEYYEFALESIYNDNDSHDSTIKKYLEDWYKQNLKNYEKFLVKSTFCNKYDDVTTFECKSDKYSKSYNLYVGLITVDEMNYAGLQTFLPNNNNYLSYSKPYWTMSIYPWNRGIYASTIFNIFKGDSAVDFTTFDNVLGYELPSIVSAAAAGDYEGNIDLVVRPVINLKSDIKVNKYADGTRTNPYKVN